MNFTRDLDRIRMLEDRVSAAEAETAKLRVDAAATITALRAQVAAMREALERIAPQTNESFEVDRTDDIPGMPPI